MFQSIINIIKEAIPKVVSSAVVNGYFKTKDFLMGSATAADAAKDFSTTMAKQAGFEVARTGLNAAASAVVPGGKIAQGAAQAAANMTVKGVQAGVEGDDVVRTVAKNGFYALNTAAVGPLYAMPLNYVTDYAVDKTVDGITFAYTNHKNYCSQRDYQMNPVCGQEYTSERVVVDDLNNSFILMTAAPAA